MQNINISTVSFDQSSSHAAQSLQNSEFFSQKETFLDFDEEYRGIFKNAEPVFSHFFESQVLIKPIPQKLRLENDQEIFKSHNVTLLIQPPFLDLYFLPITIFLVGNANLTTIAIEIITKYSQFDGTEVSVESPKPVKNPNTQRYEHIIRDQIILKFHCSKAIRYYRLKILKAITDYQIRPQQFDRFDSQSLITFYLWKFYDRNYSSQYPLKKTLSYMLYWAYKKNILKNDKLSISACVILTLFYFIKSGNNTFYNIIKEYRLNHEEQLEKLRKMYTIDKNYNTKLHQQLYLSANFSLRSRKAFYLPKKNKYIRINEILSIPFPVSQFDISIESKKIQRFNKKTDVTYSKSPTQIFLMIIMFVNRCIERQEKITIDLRQPKRILRVEKEQQFSLSIIDPVSGQNLCQSLSSKSPEFQIINQFLAVERHTKFYKESASMLASIFR